MSKNVSEAGRRDQADQGRARGVLSVQGGADLNIRSYEFAA